MERMGSSAPSYSIVLASCGTLSRRRERVATDTRTGSRLLNRPIGKRAVLAVSSSMSLVAAGMP